MRFEITTIAGASSDARVMPRKRGCFVVRRRLDQVLQVPDLLGGDACFLGRGKASVSRPLRRDVLLRGAVNVKPVLTSCFSVVLLDALPRSRALATSWSIERPGRCRGGWCRDLLFRQYRRGISPGPPPNRAEKPTQRGCFRRLAAFSAMLVASLVRLLFFFNV